MAILVLSPKEKEKEKNAFEQSLETSWQSLVTLETDLVKQSYPTGFSLQNILPGFS